MAEKNGCACKGVSRYISPDKTEISKTYEVPKRLVRIGKPRELSYAQRENLAKMRDAKRQVQG